MRALVILCLLARVAAADRQFLAETRGCHEVPEGVTTQLVGDQLYLLRDDGMSWTALWVVRLTPAPVIEQRISFSQFKPRVFRVVGDQLFVVGAMPPDYPRANPIDRGWTIFPPRVVVMSTRDFSLEPHENAAGYPACEGPPDDTRVTKAVRAGDTTVVTARSRDLWPGEEHLVVLRGNQAIGELDHMPLRRANWRTFCSTIPHPCGATLDAFGAQFEFLAIRWGELISVSSAGVAVHDLTTLDEVGGISMFELQGMSPNISLR